MKYKPIKISLRKMEIYERQGELEEVRERLGRPITLSDFIPDSVKRQEYLEELVNRNKESHLREIN